MKTWKILSAVLGVAFAVTAAAQATTLRVLSPAAAADVMRKIADEYQKKNPDVKIEVEVGGATWSAGAQLVDGAVVEGFGARRDPDRRDSPRAMGVARLGRAVQRLSRRDKAKVMAGYLKAYADADQVNGKVIALPSSPTPSSSTTARYSRKIQAPGSEDVGRDDGDRETHHGRREECAAARFLHGRCADRGNRVHVPRSTVGCRQRAHQGQEAQSRHAASARAASGCSGR